MRRSHRRWRVAIGVVVVTVATVAVSTPSTRSAERPIITAVFGDSFAAGEGLSGVDPGEAECQRALGRTSGNGEPSKAWGVTVLERLKAEQGLVEKSSWFAACTSATTNAFRTAPQDTRFLNLGVKRAKTQYDEAVAGTGAERFDVLLSSFGGNDMGFASTIMDCIGIDDAIVGAAIGARAGGWAGAAAGVAAWPVTGRCRPGLDAALRKTIDEVVVPNARRLYDQFYESTTSGALIVISGYPQIFEDPTTSWATVNAITGRCQAMHADDADMLRGVTGRLNQAIGAEVKAAAQRHRDRTWLFADVSPRFDGHGLCSDRGQQWLNGLTTGLFAGDLRYQRSFHPTQVGHTLGYANFIAGLNKVRDWRPSDVPVESLTTASSIHIGGIGPVKVGMTVAAAQDAGKVSLSIESFEDFDGLCYYATPTGLPNLTFLVESPSSLAPSDPMTGLIKRAEVSGGPYRTGSGVGVGDSIAVVRQTYSGNLREEASIYDENGVLLTFVPSNPVEKVLGVRFVSHDGRTVDRIFSGDAQAIEYAEGCA